MYFQAPNNLSINYPAIMYELSDIQDRFADNLPYQSFKRYEITLIHRNPDNDVVDKIKALPLCAFDRFFVVDQLNHYAFSLYF